MTAPPGRLVWRPEGEPGRSGVRAPGPGGGGFGLEDGGSLPGITVAYETWGTLDAAAANAVLVLHALTGDSHAAGPTGPDIPPRDGGTR